MTKVKPEDPKEGELIQVTITGFWRRNKRSGRAQIVGQVTGTVYTLPPEATMTCIPISGGGE